MKRSLRTARLFPVLAWAVASAPTARADSPAARGPSKPWVHGDPNEHARLGLERARAGGDDGIGGVLIAAAMHEFASPDEVTRELFRIGAQSNPVAVDARGLALRLSPNPWGGTWTGLASTDLTRPEERSGVIKTFTVVGPFQDGLLGKHEGPEADGASFADAAGDYSWGDFEVKPRRVLPDWVTGEGVPLDLLIHPRTESCTYVATAVELAHAPSTVVLRVASTGSARIIWDGHDIASSPEFHARAVLDRFAIALRPEPGAHLLAIKTCSSPVRDDGRVRVRFTDEAGAPVKVTATSDLTVLPADRAKSAAPALAEKKKKGAPESLGPKAGPTGEGAPARGAPWFERRETQAERALRLAADPAATTDQLVTAAIVRTLGADDDTRSPKAPGLLDRIAKTNGVTPDQLAVAGWLSAFGASKSAWLNQVIERTAESDPAVASFAQRRLAEALFLGGATDASMRILERAPFANDQDVSARVLRANLIGRTRNALDQWTLLSELDEELKQKLPIAALRELAQSAGGARPELRASLLRRLARQSGAARDASYANASSVDGSEGFERAAAELVRYASNATMLVQLSDQLSRRGRHLWAREIAFVATTVAPNLPEAWDALARAREAVAAAETDAGAESTEDPAFAEKARRRSLALRRGDASSKLELAYRQGSYADAAARSNAAGQDDGHLAEAKQYLADSREILKRRDANPAKIGEVSERILHFQRVVTYHDDRRVSQLIHQAREIVVEPRTQEELYERQIPIEGDQAELLFARVHRKDGTVVEPDEQSSVGVYIKWPQLKTGDVVEYAVHSSTSQPVGRKGDPPFYFLDYVGATVTEPILFNEVIVVAPESSPLGLDVVGGKAEEMSETVKDGRKITRLTWNHPILVADEPMAPQLTEILPVVVGSTFRSWDEFRTWYQSAIEGFSEPDDQIRRLAEELTKGKKTEKEKLEALFNYVADDIRYVNYQSGEFWLPNRPYQLLNRKQGDCDDKANLLISLLRVIGIEATPVLVQTRMTAMPSVLMAAKAAAPLFDHGIAYLPGKNGAKGTWLDATSPQSRLGPLPSMDARAKAFFVYEGPAKITDTFQGSPDDNGVNLEWKVKLGADGSASLSGQESHAGDWAFELRNNLTEEGARAPWVLQYLRPWLSTLELVGTVAYSPEKGTLKYQVTSQTFARREGDELAVPTLGSQSFLATYGARKERTLPLVLPPSLGPSHQRRAITLEAPPGFEFYPLPPGGEAKGGPFGHAKVAFKPGTTAATVTIETELVFDQSTISVGEYGDFRRWLETIDSLARQTVRLKPKKAR